MQRPYDTAQVASFRSLYLNFFTRNEVQRAVDTDYDLDRMHRAGCANFGSEVIAEHPMHTHETNLIQDEHTTEYALRMRQKCHDIRACGQDLRPGWTRDISTARNCYLIANDCCLDTGTTRDEVAERLRHDRNNDTTRHSG